MKLSLLDKVLYGITIIFIFWCLIITKLAWSRRNVRCSCSNCGRDIMDDDDYYVSEDDGDEGRRTFCIQCYEEDKRSKPKGKDVTVA